MSKHPRDARSCAGIGRQTPGWWPSPPFAATSGEPPGGMIPAEPADPRIAAPSSTTMTPARQQRKRGNTAASSRRPARSACCAVWRLALAVLLVVALPGLPQVRAAMTERVVSDPHTGLAINGIDPVGYFTEAAAVYGRPDQEVRY